MLLFFGICVGMGYPYLNRVEVGAAGLDDIPQYIAMAQFNYEAVEAPFRYRPLVPTLAGALLPALERLPLGSWNRTLLALLLINSALLSATAFLIRKISIEIGGGQTRGLVAALFFLCSFATINVYLAGFVDTVEVFVIAGCGWMLTKNAWRWLLPLMLVAASGKESAALFAFCFCLVATAQNRQHWKTVGATAVAALATLLAVRLTLQDGSVIADFWTYRRPTSWSQRLGGVLTARSLIYTFALPLIVAIPRVGALPKPFRDATYATLALAFALAAIAGIEENVSRPLFNIAAPLLSIAAAQRLCPD